MIKKIALFLSLGGVLVLTSCGGSGTGSTGQATDSSATTAEASESEPLPTLNVNEADWVLTDLSKVSSMVTASIKLPKDAKTEKNGNGGVDIILNDWYLITVSSLATSSIKDAMNGDKTLTINDDSYQDSKLLIDEPDGFVYTYTMKPEANGTTYQPESHFAFYAEKDGSFYSFVSGRPLSNYSVAGSAYTADIAQNIYKIIKSSAVVK